MRGFISKASLQRRLRLVGQVLLYGSVGTASSAVVYFLQEQIRHVHRLKQLLEHKKKFAEALQRHGISEATIQRMRKSTLEDHIREMERLGLVRLELVEEPPKWTSSPHKGQMYHVEYLPSKSRGRQRRIVQNETDDRHVESILTTGLPNMLQRWWTHIVDPITTNLIRHGTGIFMRKHWVDRIAGKRPAASSSHTLLPHLHRISQSILAKHNNLRPSRGLRQMRISRYSQAVSQPAMSQSANNVEIQNNTAQWSSDTELTMMFNEFTDHNSIPGSSRINTAESMFMEVAASLARSNTSSRGQMLAEAMAILVHIIDAGHIRLEDAMLLLLNAQFDQPAIHLYQQLLQPHRHVPSTSYYVLALARQLDAASVLNAGARLQVLAALEAFLGNTSSTYLSDVWRHLESVKSFDLVLLDIIIGISLFQSLRTLRIILNSFSDFASRHPQEFTAAIINAIERHQNRVSEERLNAIIAVDTAPEVSSMLKVRLFSFAAKERYNTVAIGILESSVEVLPTDYETAQLVRDTIIAISGHSTMSFSLQSALAYFKRCDTKIVDAILPSILGRLLKQETRTEQRVIYLQESIRILTSDRATAYLLSLPKYADQIFDTVVQDLKVETLRRLIAKGGSDAQVTDTYVAIYRSLSQAGSSVLLLRQAMIHASIAAGRAELCASIAKDTFYEHLELRSSWDSMVELMLALASGGKADDCSEVLKILDAGGNIPVHNDERLKFCSVSFELEAALGPEAWLSYAESWFNQYGLFFGPQTFDNVMAGCILIPNDDISHALLLRLLKLSSRQIHSVDVRRETIALAFKTLLAREERKGRLVDGEIHYKLFKKVCKVNERLLSQSMAELILDALEKSAAIRQDVYERFPYVMRWSRATDEKHTTMKRAIWRQNMNTALSRIQDDEDTAAFNDMLWRIFPEKGNLINRRATTLKQDLRAVSEQMHASLKTRDFHHIVKAIDKRLEDGQVVDSVLLELAVQACLRLRDLTKALHLIHTIREKGFDTSEAELQVARYEIERRTSDPTKVRNAVLTFYQQHSPTRLDTAHKLLVKAVKLLISRDRRHGLSSKSGSRDATNLILEVHGSRYAELVPFGLEEYQAFMAAYFHGQDKEGVDWTIATVLKKNLPITLAFELELARLAKHEVARLESIGQTQAAQGAHAHLRNVMQIVHQRRLAQREDTFKYQTMILNTLLHDATHPDVDDKVLISGRRDDIMLDTLVDSNKQEANLFRIHYSKKIRGEAIAATREANNKVWRRLHADSVQHPTSIQAMNDVARTRLAVMASLGANRRPSTTEESTTSVPSRNKTHVRPNYTSKPSMAMKEDPLAHSAAMASSADSAKKHTFKRISLQSNTNDRLDASISSSDRSDDDIIPWTESDTDLLNLLSERVESLRKDGNYNYDILELVGELKQDFDKSLKNREMSLEQMIRNSRELSEIYGAKGAIWKEVFQQSGFKSWGS